jgi:MFS family permease
MVGPPRRSPTSVMSSSIGFISATSAGENNKVPGDVLLGVSVASCGAFAFGYHLGILNGPLGQIALDLGFESNPFLQGLVVSSCLAGAAAGSLGGSGLADSIGRKKAFLVDCVPLFVGAIVCALASSATMMVLGRMVVGVGIGLSSALVPLYISEISPTHLRGTLGSINQLMICIGILAALMVNVLIPATSWRTMMMLAAVPAVLLGLGMGACPDSPVSPSGDSSEKMSWSDAFSSKGARIGMVLFLIQQFSGINAIVYFSTAVFKSAGIQSDALASAAVGVINVLGTIGAASLIEKTGRKDLLRLSFVGMGACMLTMALGLAVPAAASISGILSFVGTLAYVLCFAMGAGPVPGLLTAELVGNRLRGTAMAMAMATHWVCNFTIGQLFLPAVSAFGVASVYGFFAVVCGIAVVYVQGSVPETKGRELGDV